MRVCIVGSSGKLGRYMVQHALDRGYEVVGVCRAESVAKLDEFNERITIVPGATNDPAVIKRAVAGCDGVLVVLVPRGVHGHSTGTAQAVLDHAPPGARLVFSCGWHITRDGQDVYSTSRPGSIPHEADTITFGFASSIRVASSFAAKPPKTTEWIAPSRAQASIAITASGTIGM